MENHKRVHKLSPEQLKELLEYLQYLSMGEKSLDKTKDKCYIDLDKKVGHKQVVVTKGIVYLSQRKKELR